MIITPPYALGAAGQAFSGKLLRLAGGAPYRSAATGVQGVSGILYGPPGTMGELTLGSNTSLTINPFRAVVQNTQDATQGQYLIVNDAAVTATTATVTGIPTLPAQNASQFRRAYVVTYAADSQVSGVASSATTDRAVLDILPGALAASAATATYPAVPVNALLLGELLIPPTGQTVTVTPYNPRTTTRGGILPVLADGSATTGHDGSPGSHDGQYRDHPARGLERWNATLGVWAPPQRIGLARLFAYADTSRAGFTAGWQDLDLNAESINTHNAHTTGAALAVGQRFFTVPAGQAGRYSVEGGCVFDGMGANSTINSRVMRNSAVFRGCGGNSAVASASGSSSITGTKLLDLAVADTVHIQGYCSTGWSTGIYADAGPWMAVERID